MTKRTRARIAQALRVAIDTADSWIDAEMTQNRLVKGSLSFLSEEWRKPWGTYPERQEMIGGGNVQKKRR